MTLVTLAEAKAQLNITTSEHDTELGVYLAALAGAIERATGEAPEQRTATERLSFRHPVGVFALSVLPVDSLTSVARIDGTETWDVADLDVDPGSGVVVVKSGGNAVCGDVRVVYTAGHETVPGNVKLAALIILQHVWETQRGAVSGGGGALGAEETYEIGAGSGFALPRRALELLGDRLPGVA
jgi:uncharacterized phiE125 gp8 family phage protein